MIKLLKAGLFQSTDKFKKAKETLTRYSNKYEIELYVEGEGESYVDGVCYPHQKGRVLCVGPGLTRHSKKKFACYYVHLIADDKTAEYIKDIPISFFTTEYNLLQDAFENVIKLCTTKGNELLLQSRIYELLHIILKDSKGEDIYVVSENRAMQKAIRYMEDNIGERITLKDIAGYVNFSPVYFHNVFKDYMGRTPGAYLAEIRIKKAKEYLLTTDLSLEEIALRCGFKSHSYFAYCFKRSEGITPTAFKKKNRGS